MLLTSLSEMALNMLTFDESSVGGCYLVWDRKLQHQMRSVQVMLDPKNADEVHVEVEPAPNSFSIGYYFIVSTVALLASTASAFFHRQ